MTFFRLRRVLCKLGNFKVGAVTVCISSLTISLPLDFFAFTCSFDSFHLGAVVLSVGLLSGEELRLPWVFGIFGLCLTLFCISLSFLFHKTLIRFLYWHTKQSL